MPIYELTQDSILKVAEVSLASQGIRERHDLQRILRTHIDAILPDVFVLAEEYSQWEDSRRSIDLLCLDRQANLVVVELKRTEDGGHMELQAVRYAAMVSKMTFSDAVNAHAIFLENGGKDFNEAENAILKFLDWDEPQEDDFAQDTRIVLVAANFSKEITTSVIWLNEREIDVRCVRLRPYKLSERILLEVEQVLPLPEAAAYQVQLRRKASEQRQAHVRQVDWSKYDAVVDGEKFFALNKRQLFLLAVRSLVKGGVSVEQLQEYIPPGKFVGISGKLGGDEFRKLVAEARTPNGSSYDFGRLYIDDDELFFSDGKTWALSNQWSIKRLPGLDALIDKYPQGKFSYKKVADEGHG